MAYDQYLAERIKNVLQEKHITTIEKKMMGGICFMVDDKMCVGVIKNNLMARIAPDKINEALSKHGSKPMDFTGRPMKGYVFVGPEGYDMDVDLEYWVQLCLDFNPMAKSSKKRVTNLNYLSCSG